CSQGSTGQRSSEVSDFILHQGGDLLQPIRQLHLLTRTVLFQRHDDLTDRQTDRQADRQAGRQAGRQRDRQRDRQTDRQADRQTGRQTDRQTERQTDRQTDRETDRRTGRQAGMALALSRSLMLLFLCLGISGSSLLFTRCHSRSPSSSSPSSIGVSTATTQRWSPRQPGQGQNKDHRAVGSEWTS
uniref:Uncharacterized protein n=1 Tax=Acanthochromis polyacanthus TaxID=80966 RepID=A0A3Q1FLW2_9TELE